ncbi:MAG TPA: ABC transporter permease [Thermoanaerobaculaceae bacterium]|nr:ABC transporter permease [Thermoanaerobaculaceae bacterium]
MAFWEAVRTTLAEIWAHKLRSGLTLVGVILGTAAVVVMITIIEGVKVMVWDGIASLGFDGVMFVSAREPEDPIERLKQGYSRGLEAPDAGVVREEGEAIQAVAAVRISQLVVSAQGVERRVRVYGITPSYGQVHDRNVSAGRWLDEGDQIESRKVAVLGKLLAERLFGTESPLGRNVRIGDALFRVVGVETELGNKMADSGWTRREMDGVLIPLSSFRAYLQGGERIALLTVKTTSKDRLNLVKKEVERLVRRAHHGISDFEVENIADEILRAEKEVAKELRNWTIILASLAGISLLVGGIGIYSVLKISLAERLYEIGLRKAIGASDRAILLQFMVESTALSTLGALIGCLVGAGITAAASSAFPAGLALAPLGLVLGIAFAVATGLFAGVFPAMTASRMTPVEALRG